VEGNLSATTAGCVRLVVSLSEWCRTLSLLVCEWDEISYCTWFEWYDMNRLSVLKNRHE
jgi:hypothetical protein